MGEEKRFKGKAIPKHETEADWLQSAYIPDQGEIVVYDADATHTKARQKIGDGINKVKDLSFVNDDIRQELNSLIGKPTEGLEYIITIFGNASCVGLGTATDKNIIIATEYNEIPITTISGFAGTDIESIVIPNGVTLGISLQDCTELKKVILSENISNIGEMSFSGCYSLEEIKIPDKVAAVNRYAFIGCRSLKNVDFGSGIRHINEYAFYNCTSLKKIFLPISVSRIHETAFGNCENLTDIFVAWEEGAVEGAPWGSNAKIHYNSYKAKPIEDTTPIVGKDVNLKTSGVIPKSGQLVIYEPDENYAYSRIKSGDGVTDISELPLATIPSMQAVDKNRIKTYEDLGTYYFSENNWKTFIGDAASGKFGLNRAYVELSKNRGTYGMYALSETSDPIYNAWYSKSEWATRFAKEHPGEDFREPYDNEYPLLDSIAQRDEEGHLNVPKTPTRPEHAVSYDFVCALMNRLADIENDYYAGTGGLTYELSKDGTHYICTGLGDVPESSDIELASYIDGIPVEEVSTRAFAGKTLSSVTIPRTIKSLGAGAFPSNDGQIESVKIRDVAKWTQITFGGWAASPVNASYPKVYINGRYRTDLVIPEGVTGIQPRAFGHFRQFTSVKFPTTMSYIDDYAFQDCSGITELIIPAGVTNIDMAAFQRCTSIKMVQFKGRPNVIDAQAFMGCTQAMDIFVPWGEGEVANAPWGADNANIIYNADKLLTIEWGGYYSTTITTDLGYTQEVDPDSSTASVIYISSSEFDKYIYFEGINNYINSVENGTYEQLRHEDITPPNSSSTPQFDDKWKVTIYGVPATISGAGAD